MRVIASPIEPGRTLARGPDSPSAVTLYVDRSGSMAGYLDEVHGGRLGVGPRDSSLRRTLIRLLAVAGSETQVMGFGAGLTPVGSQPGGQDVIAQLMRQSFYRDQDTRLEDVLRRVAQDSARERVHLIVTDGRRGSGEASIAQYRQMGELARRWAAEAPAAPSGRPGPAPGFFAVAAIDAPFLPVGTDRGGCRGRVADSLIRCPLYVFALGPRAAAGRVLPALRAVGMHLFVAPTFADDSLRLTIERGRAGPAAAGLHTMGGRPGEPLTVLFRSTRPSGNVAAAVSVRLSAAGADGGYARDDSLVVAQFSAPLNGRAPAWERVADPGASWVSPGAPSVDSLGVTLPLELRARAQVPPTAYRVEVLSAGVPAWLPRYTAARFGDATRSYALSVLFDQLAQPPTRLAGFYVGVY